MYLSFYKERASEKCARKGGGGGEGVGLSSLSGMLARAKILTANVQKSGDLLKKGRKLRKKGEEQQSTK